MRIEVLTWGEIQCLPEFKEDVTHTSRTYWNFEKEKDFSSKYPNRIVELLEDTPDSDGDYECKEFYYPACIIKRFISDIPDYGTHRILKRSPHGIPV